MSIDEIKKELEYDYYEYEEEDDKHIKLLGIQELIINGDIII